MPAPEATRIRATAPTARAITTVPAATRTSPTRAVSVALLLAWFLGVFGAHRFYVGKIGTAVAMIFTFGGLGIWALVDIIMIAAGSFTDIDGRPITVWDTAN